MKWGVGAARSGTNTLAVALKGVHEPKPTLFQVGVPAFYGQPQARKQVRKMLEARFRRLGPRPLVSFDQALHVPMLREIDRRASFAWAVREPVACCGSLLKLGVWSGGKGCTIRPGQAQEISTRGFWRPATGWPADTPRLEKAARYWQAINAELLERYLERGEREEWTVHMLGHGPAWTKIHYNPSTYAELEGADAELVREITGETWRQVLEAVASVPSS